MEQLWLKHPMHLLFILIIRHFLQVTIFNLHLYWSNQNIPLYLLIFYLRFWPLRIFSLTCCGGTFALREIDPPANLLGITFLEAWSGLDCHHLVCVLMCECVCEWMVMCKCVCMCVYVCLWLCVCVWVGGCEWVTPLLTACYFPLACTCTLAFMMLDLTWYPSLHTGPMTIVAAILLYDHHGTVLQS